MSEYKVGQLVGFKSGLVLFLRKRLSRNNWNVICIQESELEDGRFRFPLTLVSVVSETLLSSGTDVELHIRQREENNNA